MSSYQDHLKKRIVELKKQIELDTSEKERLVNELNQLEKAAFEEDLREENNQVLLNENQGRLF